MHAPPPAPFAFGRFAIDLPAGARLRGRQQALAHLPLAAAEQKPGETLPSISDRILVERRSLPPPPGHPEVVRSARMLLPDMVSIIHHDDPDTPESIAMEAVRVAGGTVFTVRGRSSVDRADALEEGAARIGAAIVPTLAPEPAEPGFAVDRAVVAMAMHWQESAEAVFDLPDRATLALGSHSNGDLLPESLLEKHAKAAPQMAAYGAVVTPLRAGPRVLAELPGEELALYSPNGSMMLRWEHVGERRSSERPYLYVRVEIEETPDPTAALLGWDAMLVTFRRRRGS